LERRRTKACVVDNDITIYNQIFIQYDIRKITSIMIIEQHPIEK